MNPKVSSNNSAFPKMGFSQGDMNKAPFYTFFFKPGDRENK